MTNYIIIISYVDILLELTKKCFQEIKKTWFYMKYIQGRKISKQFTFVSENFNKIGQEMTSVLYIFF
jgi:hypothetical protein